MNTLAATPALTRLVVRRDRVRLAVWIVAIVGIVASSVPALDELFATDAEREARAALMRTPAGVVFGGPGYGLEDYTLGPMVVNELLMSILVAVAIMSVLLVIRHTRAEEEAGRAELLRANAVGRGAQMAAALLTCVLVNAVIGALLAGVLAGAGLALADSAVVGLGTALTGTTLGAVAAVCAHVVEHARTAVGLSMLALGGLFMLRVVGDVTEAGGSILSWLSPFAWVQQTRPYVDLRWWPLALYALVIAVLVVAAFALAARRDLGAGLVAARPGRATASSGLSGPFALHVRQQRGAILAWTIATAAFAAIFGSLANQVADMITESPDLAAFLGADGAGVTRAFFSATIAYAVIAASAYAIMSVLRMQGEERSGRAELTLSTAVSRARWMGTALAVSAASAALVLLAGGLGLGLTAAVVLDDASWIAELVGAAAAQLPVPILFAALTALAFGMLPRLVPLVWAWFAGGVVLTMFGGLIEVPEWVANASPFGLLAAVPAVEFEVVPVVVSAAVALVAGAAGILGFRRRDVGPA